VAPAESDPARIVTALTATSRPAGLTAIAMLALVQAVVGIFWAVRWFYLAGQLGERGAVLLPLAGALIFLRAVFALIIALLYLAFVVGAFKRREWAWGIGMLAVVLNLIGAAALILTGDAFGLIAVRAVVAIVIFAYLVSPAGRSALGSDTPR
jgi:hypothetical protein